jgi:hypothetical protein
LAPQEKPMHIRRAAIVVLMLCLPAAAALAETFAEQQACENDAFRVCGAAIPDRHRVFVCLMQNKSALSDACRNVMARYSLSHTTTGRGASVRDVEQQPFARDTGERN